MPLAARGQSGVMEDYPKVRPVEAVPMEVDDRTCMYLRDPLGYASQGILLPYPAFFVVSLLDGQHSVIDIQGAFARQFREVLPEEAVRDLIEQLDKLYYLEGDRFTGFAREVETRFLAADVRPLAHAGTCYDPDPDRFREQLAGYFTDPSGPGLPQGQRDGPKLRAIIAPHIDLRVGGPCYAWAYRELAERSDAEVFVLLGTSHAGGSHPFILTAKDFETPFGAIRSDRPFIERLSQDYRHELSREEILHRTEHSLEFQALFLQYVLGAKRPFTIVPILVSSLHHMIERGQPPIEDPAIGEFVEALRRTIAEDHRPICLVAGVDFAHVGHKFGDAEGLDPNFLSWVEAEDRLLIATLESGNRDGFFNEIAKNRDRRRICGFSPIYTLLSAIPGSRGRLLNYARSDDPQTQSAVSFASVAFD